MLTANQQSNARINAVMQLMRAVAPIHDCGAKAHCIATIVAPAFAGAFALPDYSGLSPSDIGRIAAAEYDCRYALPQSYYNRDTSHWAGR
jgi:hypothetical protein